MRAYDSVRDRAPGLGRELRVLAGCGWHTVRRACPQGLIMGAHAAGRGVETLRPLPPREDERPGPAKTSSPAMPVTGPIPGVPGNGPPGSRPSTRPAPPRLA